MVVVFDKSDAVDDGFLTTFLHDSWCSWEDESCFDRDSATLRVAVERIRFEAPRPSRFLGIFKATKYQIVPAELVVRNVTEVVIEPPNVQDRYYTFSYSEAKGQSLELAFEGATITVAVSGWSPIELRDTGPPSEKTKHKVVGSFAYADPEFDAEVSRRRADA